MDFRWFVVPFSVGLIFLLAFFIVRCGIWILQLTSNDKLKIIKGIIGLKSLRAAKEVVMESLLHRKIFRTNPVLGYMHMSLAFGWFLLIVIGNVEAMIIRPGQLHPPYYPIFLRFFEPANEHFFGANIFAQLMDFLLLFVLSGVFLAYFKRFRSRPLGMKKTTNLLWNDRLALISLWCIFPFRLLAESFTSGQYSTGGFLTSTLGGMFATFLPLEKMAYPAWWAYSISLGIFFVSLPFSRYMHIPTEVVLIFLRQYGIKTGKKFSGFSDVEVFSCSRCGICLDPCPMATAASIQGIQSVYYFRDVRNHQVNHENVQNCLLCGRCNEACPVGIDALSLRHISRKKVNNVLMNTFSYITPERIGNGRTLYFAGCMGHLTPSVIRSMEKIFKAAGEDFIFMDRNGSICCGRPLMMAGREEEARQIMQKNIELIINSDANRLVTSCPICYKVFKEEYNLGIDILHHTEYIDLILKEGKIDTRHSSKRLVFHDPCELGRGSGVYEQPRRVIDKVATRVEGGISFEKSICCGGSLGNTVLGAAERTKITLHSLQNLTYHQPDEIVTACPLCKKTFIQQAEVPVLDIAEVVASALKQERECSPCKPEPARKQKSLPVTAEVE